MILTEIAAEAPNRAAIITEPEGCVLTYQQLEARSNQVAHFFRERGLKPGDKVVILSENRPEYLVIAWGAHRSGLHYIGVNCHLTHAEVRVIIEDSGADIIITSEKLGQAANIAVGSSGNGRRGRLIMGAELDGWENFESVVKTFPETPISDQAEGDFMLYSSGTTGRPKGIKREVGGAVGTYPDVPGRWMREILDMKAGDVYLSPAPLYHAAPMGWCMGAHRTGATVVVMASFDPELNLELIQRHRVTHGQWVPTMFVRILKLDSVRRSQFDLSSLKFAVHGAAPCPVEVKLEMIKWWGPILFEYYACTEGVGATAIDSNEWLKKPGSVGRPLMGQPYITDEEGRELPRGEVGTVWFTGGVPFEYHGDPGKTQASIDAQGGATVGDLGYLDEDGYLFLSDRRAHLIISGGVNIYPREIEDVLIMHPDVADVAVVGLPDQDLGERVVAAVETVPGAVAGTEERLLEFAATRLARYKIPREVRLVDSLPRTPTGKMRKYELNEYLLTKPTDRKREAASAASTPSNSLNST